MRLLVIEPRKRRLRGLPFAAEGAQNSREPSALACSCTCTCTCARVYRVPALTADEGLRCAVVLQYFLQQFATAQMQQSPL